MTLEGWVDIYKMTRDSYSGWSLIYWVVLQVRMDPGATEWTCFAQQNGLVLRYFMYLSITDVSRFMLRTGLVHYGQDLLDSSA
jgi:hypothetical protein